MRTYSAIYFVKGNEISLSILKKSTSKTMATELIKSVTKERSHCWEVANKTLDFILIIVEHLQILKVSSLRYITIIGDLELMSTHATKPLYFNNYCVTWCPPFGWVMSTVLSPRTICSKRLHTIAICTTFILVNTCFQGPRLRTRFKLNPNMDK